MGTYDIPEDKDLETAVFEAIGAASMCWEKPEGAGVFDSDRAKNIAEALLAHIQGSNDNDRPLRLEPFTIMTDGNEDVGYRDIDEDMVPEYRFRLLGANGEIIASSEGYTTEEARDGTMSLIATTQIIIVPEEK